MGISKPKSKLPIKHTSSNYVIQMRNVAAKVAPCILSQLDCQKENPVITHVAMTAQVSPTVGPSSRHQANDPSARPQTWILSATALAAGA